MVVTQSGLHKISQTIEATSELKAGEGDNCGTTYKPHSYLAFVLGTCKLKHMFVKKRGKVIPLQARCGPEGG